MSQDSYSGGGRAPKLSYRQLQQRKKAMKKSFAVADKLAPKIRIHEQQEEQKADETMDQQLAEL